ncbi:MAG: hypothetical protein ACI8RD_012157 [Bacillariaceae sp.]|jgi:hypothetical protein
MKERESIIVVCLCDCVVAVCDILCGLYVMWVLSYFVFVFPYTLSI